MRRALRRVVAAALGTVLCAAAVAGAPATSQAASGCQYDCVSLGNVLTSPEFAKFTFTTTTLTHTVVVVSHSDGTSPTTYDQQDGYYWSTAYDIQAFLPSQGTQYRYDVWATDVAGHSWHERGWFRTMTRTAKVTFTRIHVIDDSDKYSAGDLLAGVRCHTSPGWTAMSPFTLDMDHEVEMESGSYLDLSMTMTCPEVPSFVQVQTAVADDDNTGIPYDIGWYPDTGGTGTGSDCCWDWSSTSNQVDDPIPTFASGTTLPIPFSRLSPAFDTNGDSPGSQANLQYEIEGNVVFQDLLTGGGLPAVQAGPVDPGLKVSAAPGALDVAWNPGAFYGGYPINQVRLDYRPTGQQAWTSLYFLPYITSYSLTGLLNGVTYDVQVSGVYGPGSPSFGLASTTATPLALPTTITGWSTAPAVLPYGSTVSTPVTVTTGGSARVVVLQDKPYGAAGWAWYTAVPTDAAGHATVKYPVLAGTVQWRVATPGNSTFALAISAPRTITAATSIAGFATTTSYLKTGTAVSDGIVVTPGAGRVVYSQFRKSGTTTWYAYAARTAASNGAVTIPLVAKAGWYQWRVYVPASATRGAAAASAIRSLHGA